jgi:hypothetical protein
LVDSLRDMGRPIEDLDINGELRRKLERLINASTTPQCRAARARIVLLRVAGRSQEASAAEVGMSCPAVIRSERRFAGSGLTGLEEARGGGPKPSIPESTRAKVITQATQPPPHRTRGSVRAMARLSGISPASVQRIWAANGIKPHLVRTFKLSRDPTFETKFWDVVGLYLNPPDKALVLCCDEKSQYQALEPVMRSSVHIASALRLAWLSRAKYMRAMAVMTNGRFIRPIFR